VVIEMPSGDRTEPFDRNPQQYEQWFEDHPFVYESEMAAVAELLPQKGVGMEIGMGTGRFAKPFGIVHGVEPSYPMRQIAIEKGLKPLNGYAENLPYADNSFDFALMVTTICFVRNPQESIREAYRVLTKRGCLIVGIVDRKSPIGRMYESRKDESVFYREASFFTTDEIVGLMENAGFGSFRFRQTVFRPLNEITAAEPVKEGHGEGSFVVIAGNAEENGAITA